MDRRPAPFPPLTAMAVYLKQLRMVIDEAVEARRLLVRHIGSLLEAARTSHRAQVGRTMAMVGLDQQGIFRALRGRLERTSAPAPCAACHRLVGHWLDETIAACGALAQAGESGDMTLLRRTQEHLAASRVDARKFNAEYERLIADLRRRVTGPGKRKRSPVTRLRRLLRRPRPAPSRAPAEE